MIIDEILEQIEYLEAEKNSYYETLKTIDDPKIKAEYRKRIRINLREVMRLKSLFISLRGDELMYGGQNDK